MHTRRRASYLPKRIWTRTTRTMTTTLSQFSSFSSLRAWRRGLRRSHERWWWWWCIDAAAAARACLGVARIAQVLDRVAALPTLRVLFREVRPPPVAPPPRPPTHDHACTHARSLQGEGARGRIPPGAHVQGAWPHARAAAAQRQRALPSLWVYPLSRAPPVTCAAPRSGRSRARHWASGSGGRSCTWRRGSRL